MSPAYKRLDKDDCVFLFVDHQVRHIVIVHRPFDLLADTFETGWDNPAGS